MKDQNKALQDQTVDPSSKPEGVPQAAPSFSWKRMLGKKWVFPAVYMSAAAIILALMWVYQGSLNRNAADELARLNEQTKTVTDNVSKPDGQAVAVNAQAEQMQWPVKDRNELDVVMGFYDDKATNDVKQAAMVEYGDTFTPHLGIDLARSDNQPFDVLAALGGKVTAIEKNPLAGNLVEITHPNGLVTVYQSLSDVKVTKGAEVKQGDLIAKAGRNELESSQGVHLHFEVRQGADGASVNPEQYLIDTTAKQH